MEIKQSLPSYGNGKGLGKPAGLLSRGSYRKCHCLLHGSAETYPVTANTRYNRQVGRAGLLRFLFVLSARGHPPGLSSLKFTSTTMADEITSFKQNSSY